LYPQFTQALEPLASAAGPLRLAMASQVRQAQQLVDDAVGKGGRVLGTTENGAPRDEVEFRPTIVADASAEMDLFREASFAPVMAVLPYDDLEEALRTDAACPYGLGASVFTRRPAQAEELARRLHTGFVT